jgi:Ran GTPase-activating protein (RanGAP) involved in mRNA processing and transport
MYELFRALEVNTTLEKVKLSDNQFHLDSDPTLINKMVDTFTHNTTLGYYDLRFNTMSNSGC